MRTIVTLLGALLALAAGSAPAQDYAADPTFNGGNYSVDAFSGSATRSYRAKNLVRLGNGDVIVAGLVPRRDSSSDSTALGLVRYDNNGVRQTWANPGAYGAFGNQYVIYDPASLAPRPIADVKDIVTIGSRVFVLVEVATYRLRNEPPFGAYFAGHAVDVLVFGIDGAYQSSAMMIDDDNTSARDVYGGGIAVYSNLQFPEVFSLVYGGTSIENGIARATFRRYTVGSDGSLADQTGVVYPNPSNYCSAPNRCEITGVALGGRASGSSVPRIYLGGSRYVSNWDFMAMRVSANGVPATDFGIGGVRQVGFNISGDNLNDGGRAIVVKAGGLVGGNSDEIYVGGDVNVRCGDGVGVIKLLADGNPDTTWGPGDLGRVYFGSAQVAPGQPCFLPATNRFAHGLALQDGNVALVGQTNRNSIVVGGEIQVDSYFALIGSDGWLASDAEFPYREGGTRARHSGLWDVDDAGNGAFTATGDVRFYASSGGGTAGNMQYATLRFAPRADLIFANGFQ